LETKKYELSDLESRLENTEQRALHLQKEFIKADSERDILSDMLRRFQATVNRVIAVNRFRGGSSDVRILACNVVELIVIGRFES